MAGTEDRKDGFVRVADLADIPAGSRKVIKSCGKPIALFRPYEGRFYAIDN